MVDLGVYVHTLSLLLSPTSQWQRLGVLLSDTRSLCLTTAAPLHSGLLNNGDLMLKDVSREDDGLYQCTVANHVGYSVCVVEVKVSGRCSGPGGPVVGRMGLEETGLCFRAQLALPALCIKHRSLPRAAGKPWE